MKRFITKLLFFLIPFPLYIGIIILIDPFNYFGMSNLITRETKLATSERLQPQLWKMIEYKKLKTPDIILGDSRSNEIRVSDIKQLTGMDVYNFSYGGGTLLDIMETFWYAANIQNLKKVYIGINFNLYNDFEKNNHVQQAKSIMKNVLTYSFSKNVLRGMVQNIKKQFFIKNYQVGVPDMNKEEFWKYQINTMGRRFYEKYKYPAAYYGELKKIAEYCEQKNIQLIFFMPPTHIDLQRRISDFNLDNDYQKFIADISKLGIVYNFDKKDAYTMDRNNFKDPFHAKNDSLMLYTMWANRNCKCCFFNLIKRYK